MTVERTLKLIAYPNDRILVKGKLINEDLENRIYEATIKKIVLYSDGSPSYYLYITTTIKGDISYYDIFTIDEEDLEKAFVEYIGTKEN